MDPVIHAPVRLSIMAVLGTTERIDFRFLARRLEVSDSLLSKHLLTLENAGYVRVTKSSLGKRLRTWIELEPAGSEAFAEYRRALDQLVR
ncbi:transcriptional regulator [Micromonospora aurantiaca (nom. illeg.)]|uniref:transcriptional regulator n=1 Tax=Micromonospora aurantiaca (nom. illeg.) TaxID=47850 RepID=UPI0035B25FE4